MPAPLVTHPTPSPLKSGDQIVAQLDGRAHSGEIVLTPERTCRVTATPGTQHAVLQRPIEEPEPASLPTHSRPVHTAVQLRRPQGEIVRRVVEHVVPRQLPLPLRTRQARPIGSFLTHDLSQMFVVRVRKLQ